MAYCLQLSINGSIFVSKYKIMLSSVLLFNMGPQEIFLIALVVLVLFGGKKIPELMKGLGKGIREFNNAKNSIEEEVKDSVLELEKKEKVRENREKTRD